MKYNPFQVEFSQGVAWLYNSQERAFYYVIYAEKVYGTNIPDVFLIGNKIFRSFIFNPDPSIPEGELDSATTANILRSYVKGRMEVFGKSDNVGNPRLGAKMLKGGRWSLEWSFPTPDDQTTAGHAFISTICHDRILTLNRPVKKGEELKQARVWLRKTANTVVELDKPIGPKGLKERLETR